MASVTARALLVSALLLACAPAQARKLRLVATYPDLADVVRRVGGEAVDVESLARGPEDPHQIVLRPSFVSKLNRADAVVYFGLTLEHSFLPGLLDAAANPRMRMDWTQTCLGEGCVDCSKGLEPLQKPASLARDQGDLHPMGNPHYNVGPDNDVLIVDNVLAGLSRLAPDQAAAFKKNADAYKAEIAAKLAEWRKLVAPLKGLKAVSYHQDTAYLAGFTGLDVVGTIELKPGIAPTPAHLERLVSLMREQKVGLIIQEQQFERKTAAWLAGKTGAKVAVIGVMGGWAKGAETQLGFQEKNLRALVEAAAP